MSQHDQNVANGSGAAVRADINDALAAIFGLSSGSSAPGTTIAHQLWADTTTNTLKKRNAANSGWIVLRTLDETFVLSRSSNTLLDISDIGKTIIATSSFTQTFDAVATLGDGWFINYYNSGTGVITLDPNSSETINGATTLNLYPGEGARITCNGSTLQAMVGAASASKQTIWIPAVSMIPRTTNGAASGSLETTTNKVMVKTLDFDASTIEYAQFAIRMPKSWNEGTVTATFAWSHASTTTNFAAMWQIQGVAVSDDDALDAAFGTAVTVTDTGGTTNDIYVSAETSAVTIAGTPAAEDYVVFQVSRKASDAADTLAIDARLHGVTLYYTADASTDA